MGSHERESRSSPRSDEPVHDGASPTKKSRSDSVIADSC